MNNNQEDYNPDNLAYKLVQETPAVSYTPVLLQFPVRQKYVYSFFKRLIDITVSLIFLVLLSPLMLLTAVFIKLETPGSIIFKQTRVGRYGKPFTIYKFRTMVKDAPSEMATSEFKDAKKYITKTGAVLRKTSMDELPQFFNILIGNMTCIGPRPLVLSEERVHTLRLSRGIYNLKPGVTGLAQINGRDLVTPEDKVDYDERYLKSFSFKTDIEIFAKTVYVVLTRKGIVDGADKSKPPSFF